MTPDTAGGPATLEHATASRRVDLLAGVADRVRRLRQAIQPANLPRVTLERAVLFDESSKATAVEPIVPVVGNSDWEY